MSISAAGSAVRMGASTGSAFVASRPHARSTSVTPTAAQQSAFVPERSATARPATTGPAAAEQQVGQKLDVKL